MAFRSNVTRDQPNRLAEPFAKVLADRHVPQVYSPGAGRVCTACPTRHCRGVVTDHLSTQLVERYRQRALTAAELLAADRHLAECAACRREWIGALALPALAQVRANVLTAEADAEHIAAAQLRAYAAGRLDALDAVDRELVESHLEFCAACQTQANAFRPAAREPWWRAFVPVWLIEMPLTLRWAGALAVLAVAVWGALRWQTAPRGPEIANASPTPTIALPSPVVSPTALSTPAALLALNDGGRQLALDAGGALTGADDWPESARQSIALALASGHVELPKNLNELRGQGDVLMGGAGNNDPAQRWTGTATLIAPRGEVSAETQPTLRWQALPGATAYVVTINDAANFREAAVSPKLSGTQHWTVTKPLARGRDYVWQVTATFEGREITAPAPNAPEAKFRVLSAAQADELTRGRQQFAGQHLPLGLLYARLGLLPEAEQELLALAKANPNVPAVQKLLREVRAKRRG